MTTKNSYITFYIKNSKIMTGSCPYPESAIKKELVSVRGTAFALILGRSDPGTGPSHREGEAIGPLNRTNASRGKFIMDSAYLCLS
jgi:hypothetical protein